MDTAYTGRLKSTTYWKNYWLFREAGKNRWDNRWGQKESDRVLGKAAKPCIFLMSHKHSSSNDRSACEERCTKITPKGSRQYEMKIFCLLISPIVLPWHPDCPSTKDRKNISRLGDFLSKEKDQTKKKDKKEKDISEFTSVVI